MAPTLESAVEELRSRTDAVISLKRWNIKLAERHFYIINNKSMFRIYTEDTTKLFCDIFSVLQGVIFYEILSPLQNLCCTIQVRV